MIKIYDYCMIRYDYDSKSDKSNIDSGFRIYLLLALFEVVILCF